MKNYKEISERDIGKIVKKKNLTGEQTQGLVQNLRIEPRFTMQESFENIYNSKNEEQKKHRKPHEVIFTDVGRLTNTIKNLKLDELKTDQKKKLVSLLLSVKIIIDSFV